MKQIGFKTQYLRSPNLEYFPFLKFHKNKLNKLYATLIPTKQQPLHSLNPVYLQGKEIEKAN